MQYEGKAFRDAEYCVAGGSQRRWRVVREEGDVVTLRSGPLELTVNCHEFSGHFITGGLETEHDYGEEIVRTVRVLHARVGQAMMLEKALMSSKAEERPNGQQVMGVMLGLSLAQGVAVQQLLEALGDFLRGGGSDDGSMLVTGTGGGSGDDGGSG